MLSPSMQAAAVGRHLFDVVVQLNSKVGWNADKTSGSGTQSTWSIRVEMHG